MEPATPEPKVATVRIQRHSLNAELAHPKNPRILPEKGSPEWESLSKSLDNDYFDPMVLNLTNMKLVSGHVRMAILMDKGYSSADFSVVNMTESRHVAAMIAANRHGGKDDDGMLADLLADLTQAEVESTGIMGDDLAALLGTGEEAPPPPVTAENEGELAEDDRSYLASKSAPDSRRCNWPKLAPSLADGGEVFLYIRLKGETFHRKISVIAVKPQKDIGKICEVALVWKKATPLR